MRTALKIATGVVGGGLPEINKVCPTITPTLGAEMWDANARTFEGVSTYNWAASGTNTIANDTNTLKIEYVDDATGAIDNLRDSSDLSADLTVGTWYQFSVDSKVNTGSVDVRLSDGGYTHTIRSETGAAGFTTTPVTVMAHHAQNGHLTFASMAAGEIIWIDNLSIKPVTETDAFLGVLGHQAGTYTCAPTVADNTACGIKLAYKDASNFLLLLVIRRATGTLNSARIYKVVAGVYTVVIAGTIGYGAIKELKAVVTASDVSLYYDNAQVGSTTAVAELASLGKAVYGFNPTAGNTVGTVTTNP